MPFEGIPLAALDFYEDLEADNSKAFWQAHREVYEDRVKAPMKALADELAPKFGEYKLFRPYRDVRFSKDKTPYKTHQGIWFGETSRYLHVSGAGLFLAAGYWSTSPAQVARLRRGVDDDIAGPLLRKAVDGVRRRGYEIGGEQLTRVPSGFDKEHERADLLRHKTLVASRELQAPDWLTTPQARPEIAKRWRAMGPVVDWLETHVGRD
ncbi:DUF2461 domain-containing protein [Jatrophihabitans endophyticus]|uniref:DUF2461 domain-containing protein n=1 Tax=Jatrophihabitans endophyticus TaxID=1206085 RepID=UPI0019FD46B6|nr:DUF2461 domain-containing protein [Jatrophihabitans endophyticus]MBE7187495.1 DUF2461 domain-containing protein [Jatrophihabitans endophyticus]